jgi:hypothetical protein
MSTGGVAPGEQAEPHDLVRPFLATAGRTRSSVGSLRYETLVQATDVSGADLRFEAARLFSLCSTAMAIAEIAARLHIPIGSAKVIVGDLIDSGHLAAHETIDTTAYDSSGIDLMSRIIEGVRNL